MYVCAAVCSAQYDGGENKANSAVDLDAPTTSKCRFLLLRNVSRDQRPPRYNTRNGRMKNPSPIANSGRVCSGIQSAASHVRPFRKCLKILIPSTLTSTRRSHSSGCYCPGGNAVTIIIRKQSRAESARSCVFHLISSTDFRTRRSIS